MRLACAIVLVVGLALPAKAQEERGWSFSGSFNGSSNTDGIVMKVDPALGYRFNNHFQTYAGVPFYFVNVSALSRLLVWSSILRAAGHMTFHAMSM